MQAQKVPASWLLALVFAVRSCAALAETQAAWLKRLVHCGALDSRRSTLLFVQVEFTVVRKWASIQPGSPPKAHTHTHTHTHTQTHTHHYTSHLAAETIQSRVLLAVNKDPDNRSSWQRSAPCCVEGQEVTVTLCRDSHLTTSDHQTFVLHEKKEERMGVSHMTWLSQLGAFSPSVSCHSSRMKCVLLSHNTLITSIRSVRRWAEIQVSFWISVFVKETRDVIDPDPVVIFTV